MVMQESRQRGVTRTKAAPPLPPPSATAFRMALVTFTLMGAGLFVGARLYDVLDDGGAGWRRAAAAVAGAAAVVVLACAVLYVEPVVVRHRLRLTQAGRPFAPALWAVTRLAAAEGARVHGVLIGPPTLTEPFWLGRPGDYRIVLPPELARLDSPALFHTLVRPELARLARHDVALDWLTSALRNVVGPLLALPVVVALARGELHAALACVWPSAVLVAAVLLVMRAWGAAPAGRPAVLGGADGLALGVLATVTLPLATDIAEAAGTGLSGLVGALIVGSAFGATIGHGLRRQALLGPMGCRTRAVVLSVLAGGLLGELSGLAGFGFGLAVRSTAVPVALAGATALISGLAALRVRGGIPVAACAAAALLWSAHEAQLVLADGGAALLATWLAAPTTLLLPGAAAALLAAAAAQRPRAEHTARSRRDAVLVGLLGGIGGGLGLVGYRAVAGAPAGGEVLHHYVATVVGAALVGAVAVALLALSRGVVGIGGGLLAGPLATLTTGLAALAVDAVAGGDPLVSAWPLLGAAVSAGFVLGAVAALVGLLPAPRLGLRRR